MKLIVMQNKKMGYEINREMVKAGGAKVAKYSLKKVEA